MKLVFVIDNLGPYHIARLRAISRLANVLAIEVRGASSEYPWMRTATVPFRRMTLLSEASKADIKPLLHAVLEEEMPDVIFVSGWSTLADLAALRWAGSKGVRVIVMSDSSADDAQRLAPVEFVKRRMLAHVSGAFVAGSRSREYAVQLGISPSKIRTGYDVVDNAYFTRKPDNAGKGFLVSARFIAKKNLPFLLRAHAAYRALHRAVAPQEALWDLTLLGDGHLRPEIEALVRENGGVLLCGFVQYPDLPTIFGRAGAFLLPSLTDQWGLVVNEAMAAGLPVLVSSRCGCVPELIQEGVNGHVLDPTDESAWAARMLALARMPPQCRASMGAASQRIIESFSPETHAKAAVELARAALARPIPRLRKLDALLLDAVAARRPA